MLGRLITAALLALLLLVGVVAVPLTMWMLQWRTLAATPPRQHYFVEGCAWQANLLFLPWGLVGLLIGALLVGARSRTMGINLTLLAVGWQVTVLCFYYQFGVLWCGDFDGQSLVSRATPEWLGPAWLAWLAMGIALGVSHIVALIRSPVSPKRPAGDTG